MILNFSGRLGKSQVYCHVTDSLSQEQRDHFRGQEAAKVTGSRKQGKEGKRSQFRYYLYNFLYNMRRKGIHPTFLVGFWSLVFGTFLAVFWLFSAKAVDNYYPSWPHLGYIFVNSCTIFIQFSNVYQQYET